MSNDRDRDEGTGRFLPTGHVTLTRVCPGCGRAFEAPHRTSRAYCSRECIPHSTSHRPDDVDLDTSWMIQGKCLGTDPELFFPERGDSTVEAKATCQGCPVQHPCLEYALEAGEKFGVWGGKSERERRKIRRARREGKEVA